MPRQPSRAGRLRVAVEQTAPRLGAVDENLSDAERRIRSLAGLADVVLFPELFTTGYRREGMDHRALAEPIPDGPTMRRLAAAASEAGLAVAGTILERADDAVFDTAICIGAQGRLLARYRKTHLHPAETAFFRPGDELVVTSFGPARIGLAICFEHAFPEIFTTLALRGATLILIPSAVPVGYEHLLDLRTRARAQDNQLFVAAANLVGFDGVTEWCGGSAIVDPRGEVIAHAGAGGEAGMVAEIDLASVAAEREREPALSFRRPELYGAAGLGHPSDD